MKRPVLSHLGTGLMALILAVVLWGFARLENREEAKFVFRVELTAPEPYKAVPETREVELSVSGPRRFIEAFRGDSHVIRKKVDPEIVRQTGTVLIEAADIDVSPRLNVAGLPFRISPVEVSEQVTMSFPLKFKTVGAPAPGYVFSPERSYFRPASVKVTGPRSILRKLDAVYAETDITGFWSSSPTDLVDSQVNVPTVIDGQQVSVDTPAARVFMAFDPQLSTKTFTDIPVKVLMPQGYPYAVSTSTATVSVTVEGTEQKLVTLQQSDVTVFAEVRAGDAPRDLPYTRVPGVILPAGVTARAMQPDSIDLMITGQTR
jgi:YbbR domain-containing protein